MGNYSFKKDDFPTSPGVYLMKSKRQKIIYIGKAKNLKKRVAQYFQKGKLDTKTVQMVQLIVSIDTVVTSNEVEALLLENNLIKQHKPKYNILLKDGKNFPFLMIDPRQEFPRLEITRTITSSKNLYFGPFLQMGGIKKILSTLNQIFPLRRCTDSTLANTKRACLLYQIGQCSAPCTGKINSSRYHQLVKGVKLLLEGKNSTLISTLKKQMYEASEQMAYEKAAGIRDQINRIEKLSIHQGIIHPELRDQDVVAHLFNGKIHQFYFIHLRNHKIIHTNHFAVTPSLNPQPEDLANLLTQFYWNHPPPPQILLAEPLIGHESLASFFKDRYHVKVTFKTPERKPQKELMQFALDNANKQLADWQQQSDKNNVIMESIQKILRLNKRPERIECYDISNLQGSHTVGSMSVSVKGKINSTHFRKFKIKQTTKQDDFACLQEVLQRRFQGSLKDIPHPDLIIIDGGKGQLHACESILHHLDLNGIAIAGLAKSRTKHNATHNQLVKKEERLFVPGRKNPINLKPGSAPFNHLTFLRDEAHRFGISYHRKIRSKELIKDSLDHIIGVGPVLKKRLLEEFGTINNIFAADLEKISSVKGVSMKIAKNILDYARSLPLLLFLLFTLYIPDNAMAKSLNFPDINIPPHLTKAPVHFTLFNGLRVLLIKNSHTSSIHFRFTYNLSTDTNKTVEAGISNIVRHLPVYQVKYGKHVKMNIEKTLFHMGGRLESKLNHDWIQYSYSIPVTDYEEILKYEAQRLRQIALSEKDLVKSKVQALKEIALNQKNSSHQNSNQSYLQHLFKAAIPSSHYAEPLYGSYKSISDVSFKTLSKYMKQHIRADKVLLVVAGNFNVAKMQKQIISRFSSIVGTYKKTSNGTPKLTSIPTKQTYKMGAPINQEKLVTICPITLPTKAMRVQAMATLKLLIQDQQELAQPIISEANLSSHKHLSFIYFVSNLIPNKGFNATKSVLSGFLQKRMQETPTPAAIKTVKRQLLYDLLNVYEQNSSVTKHFTQIHNYDKLLMDYLLVNQLEVITPTHIKKLLTTLIKKNGCSHSFLSPEQEKKAINKEEATAITEDNSFTYDKAISILKSKYPKLLTKDTVVISTHNPNPRKIIKPHEVLTHTFPNRLKLFYLPNFSKDMISISIYPRVKKQFLTKEKAGLATLFGPMLTKGTKKYTARQINKINWGSSAQFSVNKIHADLFIEDALLFMNLAAELIMNSDFPQKELEKVKIEHIKNLNLINRNRSTQTELAFKRSLYGNHPFSVPAEGTIETISALKNSDFIEFHKRYYLPNNCKVFITGNISFTQAKTLISSAFAKWKQHYIATPIHTLPHPKKERDIQVTNKEIPLLNLTLGQINPKVPKTNLATGLIGNILFFSHTNPFSYLNRILWHSKIEEYISIKGYVPHSLSMEPHFTINIDYLPESSLDNILYRIIRSISRLIRSGPNKDELNGVITSYINGGAIKIDSYESLLDQYYFYQLAGVTPTKFQQDLISITPSTIKQHFKQSINLDTITIIIDGLLSKRKPYLSQLKDPSIRLR